MRLSSLLAASALVLAPVASLPADAPTPNGKTQIIPASAEMCALLDDAATRERMDGLLFSLIWRCGRTDLLGEVASHLPNGEERLGVEGAPDARVNRLADDTTMATTQSETALTENPVTGTLCSQYNDSCEFFCADGGGGFLGVSRSTDGGANWVDQGALHPNTFGDPTVVWRQADGDFYAAGLHNSGGLGIYRSSDDCVSFTEIAVPTAGGDDKQLLAVDNTGGTHDGNLYMAWTDFGLGGVIAFTRSTDGGLTWSPQMTIGTGSVQGAWPIVAPDGDVYVAWAQFSGNTSLTIKVTRSNDGGASFTLVTDPATSVAQPRDATATANCGRRALNGNIRLLPSPQIAATPQAGGGEEVLHVVYSYDPDGLDVGDVVDVFYRRSTDNGASWSTEVRINDDATTNDQYFPTLFASGQDAIISFYDRRLDPGNLLQDTYKAISSDAGLTWGANVRISDTSSPINLDGALATCYHGDYDQSLITSGGDLVAQWADDRQAPDLADVYTDTQTGAIFADGFESGDTSAWSTVVP